jgi:hypothetical protein
MRNLFAYTILFSLIALTGSLAQEKKAPSPPSKLEFAAKNGKVTYDHTAHAKREKNDCKTCHPGAEEKKTSCAKCHVEGGTAFAVKGNCAGKCHNNAKKG